MSEESWNRADIVKPVEKVQVLAMDEGGQVRTLVYHRNLWWSEDMSMYVYFTPKFWKLK